MTASLGTIQTTGPGSGILSHDGARAGTALSELPRSASLLERRALQAPAKLSRRERQMALLVAQGFRNIEIADQLRISERTVKNTLHSVFRKAGVRDRLDLALWVVFHKVFTQPGR